MADVHPLLRTTLLGELLELLLDGPGEWTAEALAERVDGAYPTVTKEIRRLERAGIVMTRTVGRTKFVSAVRSDPAVRALRVALRSSVPRGGDDVSKKKDKKKDKKKKK
jgi:DNA-binding transcriptional ArsR family regulator